MIKTLVGNLGEWSEPYALLKIISDGFLQEGDKNYKPLDSKHEVKSLTKPQKNGNLIIKLDQNYAEVHYNGLSKLSQERSFQIQ